MPAPKFNFIPAHQLSEKPTEKTCWRVTIQKNSQMVFSREYLEIFELEGKFLRFFLDIEKKSIGWMIVEGKTNLDELNKDKKVKPNLIHKNWKVLIRKLLNTLGKEYVGKKFSKLEVKTFESSLYPNTISYVTLPDIKANVTLNGIKQ